MAGYLGSTPALAPAFAALLRGESTPTGADALTKDSLQTVFVHATQGLAAERPTVVLIDDLQFAPEDGLALFSSLAMAVPGHRILLLGTTRPGLPKAWTAGITRLEHTDSMALSRLGPKDLARLLEDALHSQRLANQLGMQIARKCDGNPFFAFEIIRGLREGQLIEQRSDGTWVTTQSIQDIQVPSSVTDLIQARLRDLSEEERELLDVASCLGFEFDPSLVAVVVGMARIPALRAFGRIESRHRLVRSVGHELVFDHHQIQESLYGGMQPQLRSAYHEAIAEALEAQAGVGGTAVEDLDGTLCVALCRHHLAGGRGDRSAPYLDAALTQLEGGFLNDRAVALADRALAVPGLLAGSARFGVLTRKYERLELLGRRDAQAQVVEEARALADESGDTSSRAKVAWASGLLSARANRSEEALRHFEEHLELVRTLGDAVGEASATVNLGSLHLEQGRIDEACVLFERGRELAVRAGNRRWEANATGNLGNAAAAQSHYEDARALYRQWLEIADEIGYRKGQVNATGSLGNAELGLGDYAGAREHFERALSLAQAMGDRRGESRAIFGLGRALSLDGRIDEARRIFERTLELFREIGDRQGVAVVSGNLGDLCHRLAQRDDAQDHYERHLVLSREIGDRLAQGHALAGLAMLAADEEGNDETLRLVEESLALLAALPDADADLAVAALALYPEAGASLLVRFHLWRATSDAAHLQEARRLLERRLQKAPEERRDAMRRGVRLHREILEACAGEGGAPSEDLQ